MVLNGGHEVMVEGEKGVKTYGERPTQPDEPLLPPFSERPTPPTISLPNEPTSTRSKTASDTSASLTARESLPTISGKGTSTFLVSELTMGEYLDYELDLSRLNRIHDALWMAGRPMRARPLHRYKMMGYQVLPTQQMDLHLLKFSTKILLKPLPEWMLDYDFWIRYVCGKKEWHASACGFLLSYVWLLTTPVDLKLAHENFLLPAWLSWIWWKEFVADLVTPPAPTISTSLSPQSQSCQEGQGIGTGDGIGKSYIDLNSLHQVNKRYHFGDLRLGRINSVYRIRFFTTHFVRGYLYGYNRYVIFFQRNFSWILIVFVFFSLVLSAMQVGAGIPPLQDDQAFLTASYGFVVFSMVSVAVVLGFVGILFCIIFFFNMYAAITHDKQERMARQRLADAAMGEKKGV